MFSVYTVDKKCTWPVYFTCVLKLKIFFAYVFWIFAHFNIEYHEFLLADESDENEDDTENKDVVKKENSTGIKPERDAVNSNSNAGEKRDGHYNVAKIEKDAKEAQRAKELKIAESELIRDLKAQVKYVIVPFKN